MKISKIFDPSSILGAPAKKEGTMYEVTIEKTNDDKLFRVVVRDYPDMNPVTKISPIGRYNFVACSIAYTRKGARRWANRAIRRYERKISKNQDEVYYVGK